MLSSHALPSTLSSLSGLTEPEVLGWRLCQQKAAGLTEPSSSEARRLLTGKTVPRKVIRQLARLCLFLYSL